VESRKLTPDEARQTMLNTWDCRISEVVDVLYGTYCMNPKSARAPKPMTLPKADDAKYLVTYAKGDDCKDHGHARKAMIDKLAKEQELWSRLRCLCARQHGDGTAASANPAAATRKCTAWCQEPFGCAAVEDA